ncbi:MAG: A/G-specific adenine glycosylase [Planctomycetota bacterium]|jgi:A/G-specific adenine glycosylase
MIHVWNDSAYKQLRRRLLAWFATRARDLPWRKTRDPYHVWISEIMLQQTQVATVIPYFERFIAAFPDEASLAAASEQEVLRLWEGLGYYRRARNLHAAAKRIVAEHGGKFPRTVDAVRSLPGIGRYTANAVLSIALDQRLPILEANTVRLHSRLLAYAGPPTTTAATKLLWEFAEAVLPTRDAGRFNQALMELGSLVCVPRNPACAECPLADLCPTRMGGLQDKIPAAVKKTRYEDVTETAVLVRHGARVLVRQCGPGERWAGLWDFPRHSAPLEGRSLIDATREMTGVDIELYRELTVIKHGVTRYRITLRCIEAHARSVPDTLPPAVRWVTTEELQALPLSTTGRKLACHA